LADRLLEARLLVKTQEAVEVAHEALLRQEPLASWIGTAQSDLLLRDQVFREASEWAALKESHEALAGFARVAGRLAAAEALFRRPDFAHYSERVSACLSACRSKWDAEVLRIRSDGTSKTAEAPQLERPQVFVSYALGDISSKEDRQRQEVVERLCRTLVNENWKVIRDKEELHYGDLISTFMKKLGQARLVIVVLSDKYLRSPYCMAELHALYQNSRQEKRVFLDRIIPLVLDDARFGTPTEH